MVICSKIRGKLSGIENEVDLIIDFSMMLRGHTEKKDRKIYYVTSGAFLLKGKFHNEYGAGMLCGMIFLTVHRYLAYFTMLV